MKLLWTGFILFEIILLSTLIMFVVLDFNAAALYTLWALFGVMCIFSVLMLVLLWRKKK